MRLERASWSYSELERAFENYLPFLNRLSFGWTAQKSSARLQQQLPDVP
jgi:hypothetical protein